MTIKKDLQRSRRIGFGIAIIILSAISISAQRRERVIDNWRPLHYDVAITFNDQLTELQRATTEVTALVLKDNVSVIDLDFGSMAIDSVLIGGQPAHFERRPELLNVSLTHAAHVGDKITIAIAYHGRPTDGLVFATDRDGKPSVTGDNWPNRVHQWIPCLDHPSAKATVTFMITAPAKETVVGNGRLGEIAWSNSPRTWTYTEHVPIPAYCMVIAVSEGAKIEAPATPVAPLSFYVPQRDRSYAEKGFSAGAPALAFFSATIAPYPYEKLALIVGATRYGGMENSSAIVFANGLFDLRSSEKMSAHFGIPSRIESVVAHEIAHQWFGDSVTESTWADLWLSEGFATYFAGLFMEKYEGEDAFRDYMRNAATRYFNYEKQRNAPIHDTETQDLMRLLNENNYEKGAWVLHMLRKRLGDEAFFRGLRLYYSAHRDANATTEDLRASLEQASGKDLKEFFARWIYGAGHPIYDLASFDEERSTRRFLILTLSQKQTGAAFLDPVPIEITTGGAKKVMTIQPESKTTTVRFPIEKAPTSVRLDPDETLLKEIVTKR